jgi:hypothetical protein
VLDCLNRLVANNIKPKDSQFTIVHPRLQESHFPPHFHGAIGAIDETHNPIVVPSSATITHFGWYRDANEDFVPYIDEVTTSQPHANGEEESNMNVLRDSIADGLMTMW